MVLVGVIVVVVGVVVVVFDRLIVFRSPEYEMPNVKYCDQHISDVYSSSIFFKHIVLYEPIYIW